jgi:hypothetical protein
MAVTFDVLEIKANDAIMRSLANKSLRVGTDYIDGIFDDRPSEVNFIESSDPTFTIKTSDATNIFMDTRIYDDEKEYRVIGIEQEDGGTTKLQLRFKW